MKNGWTEVALGEVLVPSNVSTDILPEVEYREVTVSLWGRGVRLRRRLQGSEIASNSRNTASLGDFIISKIDARHGAYGFIPKDLDGAVVSNDFPLFRIASSELHPRWLYWISKSAFFIDLCRRASKGSTNRVRLKESLFLDLKIPLPPLAEQDRIVARLDAIEQRLNRIQKLREESEKEFLALLTGMSHRWDLTSEEKAKAGWSEVSLGEILTHTADCVAVDATQSYPNLGIYSYARGTFTKPVIEGSKSSAPSLFRVRSGQFIYSRLFAFEGAYGLVDENQDGFFVSNEFPSFEIDHVRMLPEFLMAYFKSKTIWDKLASQSTGLGDRRRRVHPDIILGHRLHLPPIKYQQSVKEAFQRLNEVHRAGIKAEHEALMPSLLDRIFNQPD